jgi:Ser/Thr protein kinase RdoA (MazF antagonist)
VTAEPSQVLSAWPGLDHGDVAPLGNGLINDTFVVTASGGRHVLQRVNPIFGPEVQQDIEAVTRRLEERGLVTPRLVPTGAGELYLRHGDDVWRVLTWVEGVTHDRVQNPSQARAAGRLLARFHSALADLDYTFQSTRVGVHDTPAHLQRLREAVAELSGHRLHAEVHGLARELLAAARDLPAVGPLPERVVHGDPKLNNMLFSSTEPSEAICMLDLDTCTRMQLHLELGDAWRSWCNPSGEDEDDAEFDLQVYRSSWEGYQQGCTMDLAREERDALVHGVEWITLELAARFLADALREDYFGWDRTRYPARGEHNLVRARGQWALHRAVMKCRAERATTLE